MKGYEAMSKLTTRTACILLIAFLFGCASSGRKRDSIDLISIDEEITLGKKITDEISKRFEIIDDRQVSEYFQRLGRGIADNSDWSKLDYKFFIIDRPALYAFSVLGGNVFISRGLIERADNVSEVACLIAHEIGHIVSRHGTRQLIKTYGPAVSAQSILGENPEIYRDMVDHLVEINGILDYGEKNELKASELAVKYAWKTGYDPLGLVSILERIKVLEVNDINSVAQYQLTHPDVNKRIKSVSKAIAILPYKRGLKLDTDEFQLMKTRLGQIP